MGNCCFRSARVLAVVGAVTALSAAALGQTASHSSLNTPMGKPTPGVTVANTAPGLVPIEKQVPSASWSNFDQEAAMKAANAGVPAPSKPSPRGAPPNDDCANAIVIGNGRTPYDATGATTDGTMPCGFNVGNDVWFLYTATETGLTTVTSCDSDRSYDTVMTVYEGGCGGPAIGCNDDASPSCPNPPAPFSGSTVSFTATAGQTYLIQVGSYNSAAAGTGGVTVTPAGPCDLTPPGPGTPENEPCGTDANGGCNSIPEIFGSISCGEVINGTAWASGGTRDTDWYHLEITERSVITVQGQAQFPLQLFIIGGSCPATIIASGTAPRCGIATVTAEVCGSVRIFAGNTGFDGNPCGADNDYWIQVVSCVPSKVMGPANDDCANATEVGEGTFDYDLTGACNDWPGTCGATGSAPDVWFRYTASFTGSAVASTCGSNPDPVMTILEECGGPQIACLDDSCGLQQEIVFSVVAGEDYYIRMAGFNGGIHNGFLTISELAPCILKPPGPGTPENEPCGTDANGGCNSIPEIFGTIACGEVVSGSAWASGGTRDTDWYDLALDGPHAVTISGQAQFPLQLFILDNNCPPAIVAAAAAPRCGVATLTALVGGSCRIFAGNQGFDGNPCGADNDYWLSVDSCVPVEGPPNDACADAIEISGPGPHNFDSSLATTDGNPDPVCLAFGTDQITNDLWFIWTSDCAAGMEVEVSLCGLTAIDTRVAVYEGDSCVGPILACNDDATCGLQSIARFIAGPPGSRYMIRVGNYPGAVGGPGAFTTECNKPCLGIDPDPNGISENEDCGLDTNGGCNSVPTNLFFDLTENVTVNGSIWADLGTRDTDWYRATVPDSGMVSMEITTEVPAVVFILTIDGIDPCGAIAIPAIGGAEECESGSVFLGGLTPGTPIYFFVSTGTPDGGAIFDGYPCGRTPGNDYVATFDIGVSGGNPCPCNFNGDASLNSQDFFDFLTCFFGGACPPGTSADYNQDNVVNSQDFFDFLTCFFAPPAGCP